MSSSNYYTNLLIKKRIEETIEFVNKFCIQRNLNPSLKNFLFFKRPNAYFPESFYYLHKIPNYYLLFSKSFWNFYSSLEDEDIKKDIEKILNLESFNTILWSLKLFNKELFFFLKEILKEDFIFSE